MSKRIGIIGAGPAGALCAIFLAQNLKNADITIFDEKKPLTTLLPTGGGRCNLTYFEPDNREFVKFYPRGEKFLLSVLSKFNSLSAIEFFESIGVETFVQDDSRVFPSCESSKQVASVLNYLLEKYHVKVEKVTVSDVSIENDLFLVESDSQKHYFFQTLIVATGGSDCGFKFAQSLGHSVRQPKPALIPLEILENEFYDLSGLTLSEVNVSAYFNNKKVAETYGDFLFTHKSISGPAVFKVSSLCAYIDFSRKNPLTLKINVSGYSETSLMDSLNAEIVESPKKSVKNAFATIVPKRLIELILSIYNIDAEKEITHLKKKEKTIIVNSLTELTLNVYARASEKAIVTAGGVSLNEINNKTMQSKIHDNLYFIGEVLDIDGFTGGFNLQNCWSTAFVCAESITNKD